MWSMSMGLRIKDNKVFVIWKWQVLHPQDKTVIIVRGIAVCFSRTIQTQSLKQSHTIPFKVIGCIKEKLSKSTLKSKCTY